MLLNILQFTGQPSTTHAKIMQSKIAIVPRLRNPVLEGRLFAQQIFSK